eukprot:3512197-Rhodomonas_salina.1
MEQERLTALRKNVAQPWIPTMGPGHSIKGCRRWPHKLLRHEILHAHQHEDRRQPEPPSGQ